MSIERPVVETKELVWDCAVGTVDEDHEWEFCDDSFDHEYGTKVIHYFQCKHCGKQRELTSADYYEDD